MSRWRSLRHLVLGAALLASLVAAGCFGGDGRKGQAAALEDELMTPGSLAICSDATRPPLEFRTSDGVLRGFEVDLLTEVAERLELEPAWVDVRRTEIVDAVVAGRCDAAASTLTVRRDGGGTLGRMAAIAYLGVPVSLLVRRGEQPLAVTGLCGRRVGAFAQSLEHDLLQQHRSACVEDGQPPVEPVALTGTPVALEQLRSGELDAILDAHPVSAWFARRQTDRFDLAWILGEEIVHWAIGVGLEKPELYHAIRANLRELGHDGTVRALLHEWGLDRAGVTPLPTT
jgi:polar amino acid transport system substrate-binding protein